MRKKALDAPYERGNREQMIGIRMEVAHPRAARGEEDHLVNPSSQFAPGKPEKLHFYNKDQFVLRKGVRDQREDFHMRDVNEQAQINREKG